MAEWIQMPFGMVSGVGQGIGVLGGGDHRIGWDSFEGEFVASHCNQWGLCDVALPKLLWAGLVFTRDSIYAIARICYGNSVCPSVCPSVTRVDQSKTVKARITQFSPYSSPIPLVFRG